jgi:hypothetical protein
LDIAVAIVAIVVIVVLVEPVRVMLRDLVMSVARTILSTAAVPQSAPSVPGAEHAGIERMEEERRTAMMPSDHGRAVGTDIFLHNFIGRPVLVQTSSTSPGNAPGRAGAFQGLLETILGDALVLRSPAGQVFLYKAAIVAIEMRQPAARDIGES